MKEAFHRGIIVTVSSTTHTDDYAFSLQKSLIALTRVGTATIGVVEQAGLWTAPGEVDLLLWNPETLGRTHQLPIDNGLIELRRVIM
jgi:hypothetical protein